MKTNSNTQILELYIKEVVKNEVRNLVSSMIKEELEAALGKMSLQEDVVVSKKAKPSPSEIKNIMERHFSVDGGTISPRGVPVTGHRLPAVGPNAPPPSSVDDLINRDWSKTLK